LANKSIKQDKIIESPSQDGILLAAEKLHDKEKQKNDKQMDE
jgi:hypothetical protein